MPKKLNIATKHLQESEYLNIAFITKYPLLSVMWRNVAFKPDK